MILAFLVFIVGIIYLGIEAYMKLAYKTDRLLDALNQIKYLVENSKLYVNEESWEQTSLEALNVADTALENFKHDLVNLPTQYRN